MGLSAPKTVYGVHSLTLYNRTDFEPYGILKVIGNLSFNLSGDFIDLYGGSSKYPWASETGVLSAELSGTIKEIPNFAFERFLGGSVTANSAEATGNVGTLTNQNGTSAMSATTGIATATAKAGSEADLKTGLYVVKVASGTTVDVFCMSDYDFDKGTSKVFEDDDLKIVAAAVTITSASGVDLAGYGITLTGGSGAIAMTIGDSAYFYVRKVNAGSDLITIGQSTATFPAFGCVVASQKTGEGHTFETQLFNCRGIGMPISHNENEWLNSDISIRAMYDSAQNAVALFRRTKGA